MKKRTLYLILFLVFSGFRILQEEKTILFFGDSLTAGYGLTPEQAFPARVDEMINKREHKFKVVNAGLSGETSAGGLNRINWILHQKIDIFILELGANDGLRGLPLEQTRKNLQGIIDKVKAKNPNVVIILAGMMVPPNMGKEYSDAFQKIFPDLAEKNDAMLIPFLLTGVAGDPKLNQPDGIHPNVKGHEIVANNVMEVLKKIL